MGPTPPGEPRHLAFARFDQPAARRIQTISRFTRASLPPRVSAARRRPVTLEESLKRRINRVYSTRCSSSPDRRPSCWLLHELRIEPLSHLTLGTRSVVGRLGDALHDDRSVLADLGGGRAAIRVAAGKIDGAAAIARRGEEDQVRLAGWRDLREQGMCAATASEEQTRPGPPRQPGRRGDDGVA